MFCSNEQAAGLEGEIVCPSRPARSDPLSRMDLNLGLWFCRVMRIGFGCFLFSTGDTPCSFRSLISPQKDWRRPASLHWTPTNILLVFLVFIVPFSEIFLCMKCETRFVKGVEGLST
jgi:hypothetical protein